MPSKSLFPLAVLAGAATLFSTPEPRLQAATTNVSYGFAFFNPKVVQINTGDTVKWVGGGTHTLLGTGSDPMCGGASLPCSHEFLNPGTYAYQCTIPGHAAAGMTGLVMVAGAPIVNPAVLTNATFLVGGQFRFTLISTPGRTNIVQASTNPASATDWVPINTNAPASGRFTFTDTNTAPFSSRVYRVVEPR